MTLGSFWLRRVAGTAARTKRGRNARYRVRLVLENLEERALPSSTALADLGPIIATPGAHVFTSRQVLPAGGPGQAGGFFTPSEISQAYGFNQITFDNGSVKGDGSGQTIAIVDGYDQPNIASDLAVFDSTYGLPAPPSFLKVNQNGGTNYPPSDPGWGLEISLDVEWAHAMAPGANILLVESTDVYAGVNYARSLPGVSVVSMSWGGSEWSTESAWDYKFTTPAGHGGVTFVASTGDDGGLLEYPSASPNVLAVGGTQLTTDSLGNYLSETGWSGSAGGISSSESQPAYQQGVVTQSSTMRTVPDVAYNAASPYAVYDTSSYSGWVEVYGTSAGAPQWAALVAIADQGRALAGQGSLDGPSQTLPMLYQLPSSDFHDITSGSNAAYSAGPGYDLVTGLGSPVANRIVPALAGLPVPSQAGPSVVTPAQTTSSPVTGTTTSLSVLGADPGGPSSLTYTWSVSSAPTGAATPTFNLNGTNAAQNTTATFYQAGTYTFQVTLTDPAGLTATSSVTVTVDQTLTSISVSPGSVTLTDKGQQQFQATGLDQFVQQMASQPSNYIWSIASGGVGPSTATASTPLPIREPARPRCRPPAAASPARPPSRSRRFRRSSPSRPAPTRIRSPALRPSSKCRLPTPKAPISPTPGRSPASRPARPLRPSLTPTAITPTSPSTRPAATPSPSPSRTRSACRPRAA